MGMIRVVPFVAFLLVCLASYAAAAAVNGAMVAVTPMNIMFHPTGDDGSYVFTYVTGSSAAQTQHKFPPYTKVPKTNVYYGTSKSALSKVVTGESKHFEHLKYASDVHTVVLKGLTAGTKYYYAVGDHETGLDATSPTYSFTAGPVKKWAIYGDYGYTNMEQSLKTLLDDGAKGLYDGIIHVGDIAYDLHNGNGVRGDDFIEALQPVMTAMPYIMVVGNHEKEGNFTHFTSRFRSLETLGRSSGSNTALWWSLDVPQAHLVTIDTEVYSYFPDPGQQKRQLAWLEKDLIAANKRRSVTPWIVMLAHKCDWQDEVDYTDFRILAHKYGVDVLVCGHQHNYQRLFPGLRRNIQTFEDEHLFTDPSFWTQIVVGSPGCQEKISKGLAPYKGSVAQYFLSYGYGMMEIKNKTHFEWEWKQTNTATMFNGETVQDALAIWEQNRSGRLTAEASIKDWMTLIQHSHGPRDELSAAHFEYNRDLDY